MNQSSSRSNHSLLILLLLGTAAAASPLYWIQSRMVGGFGDWWTSFYPPTIVFLHGGDPYRNWPFYGPFWTLIPMIPFALLGEQWGGVALFYFNALSYAFIAYRMRARLPALILFLLSPLVFRELYQGNIDSMVLWGTLMPPVLGLFFVSMKPHMGIIIAVYWAYHIWREHGVRRLVLTFLPITAAAALSFILYKNWFLYSRFLISTPWNVSLLPWSIPVGLALAYWSLRKKKLNLSLAAAPFLAPYVQLGSWAMVQIGALDNNLVMFAMFVVSWVFYLGMMLFQQHP